MAGQSLEKLLYIISGIDFPMYYTTSEEVEPGIAMVYGPPAGLLVCHPDNLPLLQEGIACGRLVHLRDCHPSSEHEYLYRLAGQYTAEDYPDMLEKARAEASECPEELDG